ncbi:unnamed protein product [Spirodela intermedia]|uniref:RING-type domain-containing protein n=1 Tax=Spirodela intermedia TaxID=51605 RepID=A0A7I8IA58_SPIIN|nr:unnamed protein product [Spirodela intermedia]CAA6654293.1 unnamed protein product [Spirodela intermedia]
MRPGEGVPEGDDVAGGDGALASPSLVPCSICLEAVKDDGERSTAKLLCGHQFHLDCVGSAFNAKGVMQCPNCRKIEKGNWLYANGCFSFREVSVDDWSYDEDLYDLNYSEMPYGVHWCPFTRLTRVPSSFEEGESPSISYHSLDGHAVFVHPAPSLGHPCPYVARLHPLQSSSSSTPPVSTETLIDPPFHHSWSNPFRQSIIWLPIHSPLLTSITLVKSSILLPIGMAAKAQPIKPIINSKYSHILLPRSASRAGTSSEPTASHHAGGSPPRGRLQDFNSAHRHHHSAMPPMAAGTRRPNSTRPQDAETSRVNRFYAWERDQDSGWWGPFQPAPRTSEAGSWPGGSSSLGRPEGFSHPPPILPPWVYPFI